MLITGQQESQQHYQQRQLAHPPPLHNSKNIPMRHIDRRCYFMGPPERESSITSWA